MWHVLHDKFVFWHTQGYPLGVGQDWWGWGWGLGRELCVPVGHAARPTNTARSKSKGRERAQKVGGGAVLVGGGRGGWGRTGGGGAGLVGAGGWEESFCVPVGCAARPTNMTRSRFLPRMHCTKMASSGDKSKLKKKSKTLAEKGKNRFLGNDMKGGGREG